jgi:chitodextrinase
MSVSTLRRLAIFALGALGVLAVVGVSAGSALAATQLPTPGVPVASSVTTTSVSLSWTASAGPVANYTVQVIDPVGTPWRFLATVAGTSYTHAGLTPDTVYTYRVIANPADGGYTASNPSGPLYSRTAPLPDSVPPTTPGVPRAFPVSTVSATITFGFSTDNHRVAAYWVQRQVDGVWTDWASNSVTTVYLNGLTPSTSYTVVVVAEDANGNRSPRSAPHTFTTRATEPNPTCRVQVLAFGPSILLNFTIENMTAATVVEHWTATFTLPTDHVVQYAFNVSVTRSGTVATATPLVYLTRIGPGGTATFGLNVTRPAGSPLPSGYTLNASAGAWPCTTT